MAESILGTLRRVAIQRQEMTVAPYPPVQERPIDKTLFDYFFRVQSEIEKQGRMDYHRYATRLWQEVVEGGVETPNLASDPQFRRFEGNLILGLHDIDMRQHVYGELVENLGQMIAKYGRSIRKVAVWTTGDNEATGYQPAKIARSGIITAFARAVKSHHEGDVVKSNEFTAAKTATIISDNKFNELGGYLTAEEGLTKLVVIEDSRSNLRRVAKMVEAINVARSGDKRIEFIPVWATYSREGMQARAKADKEGTMDALEAEKAAFHAIDSPKDILDDRFGEIFAGADVLVDFDGVAGNNLTMREAQAQANKIILDNLAKAAA